MHLLQGFKNAKEWVAQRRQKPAERCLINLDGSPYGTNGLERFLSTPTVQKQAVTGLFLAAAGAMTMPHSYRSYFFVGALIANTLVLIPFSRSLEKLYGVLGSIVFHKLPINKHAAIDTSGYRIGGDPQETQNVIDNFRVDSRLTLAITSGSAVLSLLAPTALSTFSPLTGLIANLTLPTLLTLGACWRLRAAKKLEKGEWTLHTAPPLPHKKEEKARVPVGVKAPVINDYSLR